MVSPGDAPGRSRPVARTRHKRLEQREQPDNTPGQIGFLGDMAEGRIRWWPPSTQYRSRGA